MSSKRSFTGVDFLGVDLLIIPCIDITVVHDFGSYEHKDFKRHLNTCLNLPHEFQLSERLVLKLPLAVLPFKRIEEIFFRNIALFKITKLDFEIAISKPVLVARIHRSFSIPTEVLERSLPLRKGEDFSGQFIMCNAHPCMTGQVDGFENPGVCFFHHFGSRLIFRPGNHTDPTETLATKARDFHELGDRELMRIKTNQIAPNRNQERII